MVTEVASCTFDRLELDSGATLAPVEVAYETYGELNAARSNAILIVHAFSGDAHAAGEAGPGQPTPGWWNSLIGPGRPLDPARHFIVCANVIGGCQGSTGPASASPDGTPAMSDLALAGIALTGAVLAAGNAVRTRRHGRARRGGSA